MEKESLTNIVGENVNPSYTVVSNMKDFFSKGLGGTTCYGFKPKNGGYIFNPEKADNVFVDEYDPITEKQIKVKLEGLISRIKDGEKGDKFDEEINNALGEAYDTRLPCYIEYHIDILNALKKRNGGKL